MISLENELDRAWLIGEKAKRDYIQACVDAVNDEKMFNNFKRDGRYTDILEHSGYKHMGDVFFNEIKTLYPHLLNSFEKFVKNDMIGNPELYLWENIQTSPGTLRYVKTLGEIEKKIGSLDNMNIAEIGSGYGGQCLIINQYFKPKSYKIYDLDESAMLAKKYLNSFDINVDIGDLKAKEEDFDLVISNYAFSECNTQLQDLYIEKVVKKSKHGFITINSFAPHVERNNDTLIKIFGNLFERVDCMAERYEHPTFVLSW